MSKSGCDNFRRGTFRTVKVSENRGDDSCRCVNKSLGLRFSIRDLKIVVEICFLEIRSNLVSRPQNLNSATPIWSKSNLSKNASDFSKKKSIKI